MASCLVAVPREYMASHRARGVPMNVEQAGGDHANLLAYPLVSKHAAVLASHADVVEGITVYSDYLRRNGREWLAGLYRHVLAVATAYDLELCDDTDAKRRAWQEFCNDIVKLYTMRYVLTGEQIAIAPLGAMAWDATAQVMA